MKNDNKKRTISKREPSNNSYVISQMVRNWYVKSFVSYHNPYEIRDYNLNGGAGEI